MLTMARIFHPVGHGAFYTEEFKSNAIKYTMVYDCGGTKINDEIDSAFTKGQNIDLVFISHFHNDHINGLKYLLKEFNVKRIILPLLHYKQKIELFLSNQDSSTFVQEICLNPKTIITEYSKFKDIKVTFVTSKTSENSNSIDISNMNEEIDSGRVLTINLLSDWIYVPFNFEYEKRSEELVKKLFKKFTKEVNKLKKEGISSQIDIFKVIFKIHKKEIKEIYDSIGIDRKNKNINTNSLVLYSGVNNKSYKTKSNFKINKYNRYRKQVGCIYMGDYNAKDNFTDFEKKFKSYFEYLSVIQIPHHGSKNNYHSGLNYKDNLFSVISAPEKNSKGAHPHSTVISKISLNNGIPLIVTEDDDTNIIQKIEIKV